MTKDVRKPTFTGDIPVSGDERSGVYSYYHPETDSTYIGSTVLSYGRFIQHTSALKRGQHSNRNLQHAFNVDPRFVISFEELPEEDQNKVLKVRQRLVREIEQKLIDEFPDKSRLLNISYDTRSFASGLEVSLETRQKISHAMKNRTVSEETRKRRSETMKGRVIPPEVCEKMSAGSTKKSVKVGDTIYRNSSKAAEALGISRSTVKFRCKSANNTEFSYIEAPKMESERAARRRYSAELNKNPTL